MSEETDELGLLGTYSVVIVPPDDDSGHWLVTLGSWDDEREAYTAAGDGPLVETEEEAMQEAGRVLHWLRTQPRDGDLSKVWERMQDQRGREEGLGELWPPPRRPWDV